MVSALPPGVMPAGVAQTHLIMLSATLQRARGEEDARWGEAAICGGYRDGPLCLEIILTADF